VHCKNCMQFGLLASAVLTVCLLLLSRGHSLCTISMRLACRARSTPEANADDLHSIAFAFGRFIAVAMPEPSSLNKRRTWLRQPAPTTSALYGVTTCTNGVIAGGDGGTVLWSTNGIDWNLSSAGETNNIRTIAYGNGQFCGPYLPVHLTDLIECCILDTKFDDNSLRVAPLWPLLWRRFVLCVWREWHGSHVRRWPKLDAPVLASAVQLSCAALTVTVSSSWPARVLVMAKLHCSTNGFSWTPLQ